MPALGKLSQIAASPGDEEFLFEVYASTRGEEVAAWGWQPAQQTAFLQMQYRARQQSYAMAHAGADHSILMLDGVRAGAAIVSRTPSEVRLVDIALLPEYRRQGLGGRWLAALIDESAAASLPLRLSVAQGNPAIRLYERLGFRRKSADAMYIEMEHNALGTE